MESTKTLEPSDEDWMSLQSFSSSSCANSFLEGNEAGWGG